MTPAAPPNQGEAVKTLRRVGWPGAGARRQSSSGPVPRQGDQAPHRAPQASTTGPAAQGSASQAPPSRDQQPGFPFPPASARSTPTLPPIPVSKWSVDAVVEVLRRHGFRVGSVPFGGSERVVSTLPSTWPWQQRATAYRAALRELAGAPGLVLQSE